MTLPIRINSDAIQHCIAVKHLALKRVNGLLPVGEYFKELGEAHHFQYVCDLGTRIEQLEILLQAAIAGAVH